MKKVSAEEHYKKFPECNKEEVLKLMEWNKQQPHLPVLDETEIIAFFHSCYYSFELAKQTIDICYTTKTHCPEFFANLDTTQPGIQNPMNVLNICELKKRMPNGYRVFLGSLRDCDASKYNFAEGLKLYCTIFEQGLIENGCASGDVIVIDMTGVTLGHVARLGIMTMKKFLFYLQEAMPLRLCGFHFLNAVPFMDKILALMRPFLTTDFINMMKVHTTMDTFYEFVPQEVMPSDYGGQDLSVRELVDGGYARLVENRDYFLEEEKTRRVNEKLRPGRPKNASDLFGAEGNFKKLDFD